MPVGAGTAPAQRRRTTGGTVARTSNVEPMVTARTASKKAERKLATPVADDGARMTKQDRVLTMLHRTDGASIPEIMAATDWQQHSVRGFFAGTVKKKLGFDLVSSRDGSKARRYRIVPKGSAGSRR